MLNQMPRAQNVIKLFFIWFCLLTLSCSPTKKLINQNEIDVLNAIIKSSKFSVYYKTIDNNGTSLKKPIGDYINNDLEFQFCETNIINYNEVGFLKKEFNNQEIIKLSKLPSIYKKNLTKEKKQFETTYISLPILFRNNKMAIYFNSQTYGAEFILLQKNKTEWKIICSSMVWIE